MEEDPADSGKLSLFYSIVYFVRKGEVSLVKPNPKGAPDLVYAGFKEG